MSLSLSISCKCTVPVRKSSYTRVSKKNREENVNFMVFEVITVVGFEGFLEKSQTHGI